MPSYFFHIKIDLIHSSGDSAAAILLQRDRWLLQSQASRHSPPLSRASKTAGSEASRTDAGLLEHDSRVGKVYYKSIEMVMPQSDASVSDSGSSRGNITTGLSSIYPGLATKGRFEPATNELGYGVVRLFRDEAETPGLYDLANPTKPSRGNRKSTARNDASGSSTTPGSASTLPDEDFTTLCILAIPSWLDVSQLISFLGEEARENVSHFRMIRTESPGRYMLLMKFRNGKTAREWRRTWNGKVFDSAAPMEYCHVVFVKSVEVRGIGQDMDNAMESLGDGLDHLGLSKETTKEQLPSIASLGSKPMPPPTRPLKEMPTCPVCLERMDESSGLLTIPCQHTFHCTCLVKWQKNGCPVCRSTQEEKVQGNPDEPRPINECSICRAEINLWICLICGNTGCGRYDGAHAQQHWKESGHAFSMDLADQSIWDYDSDSYVHRIMQNKIDGKMIELPSAAGDYDNQASEEDFVPRSKFDAQGAEYTQLLMSQLDNQRAYYEGKMESAADKASEAVRAAAQASDTVAKVVQDLSALQTSHDVLVKDILPSLERDRDRLDQRATKHDERSRQMEKLWQEEKAIAESLREKVTYQDNEIDKLQSELAKFAVFKKELEDQNRDLLAFISTADKVEKIKDPELLEALKEGKIEIAGPSNGSPNDGGKDAATDKKRRRRNKHKSRGKGGREDALNALGVGASPGENAEKDDSETEDKGKQRADPEGTLSDTKEDDRGEVEQD